MKCDLGKVCMQYCLYLTHPDGDSLYSERLMRGRGRMRVSLLCINHSALDKTEIKQVMHR